LRRDFAGASDATLHLGALLGRLFAPINSWVRFIRKAALKNDGSASIRPAIWADRRYLALSS
jgi:hypothetical protein